MGIVFCQEHNLFQITTLTTEYCIGITDERYVGHVYYGKRLEDARCACLLRTEERPFVPSTNQRDKGAFLDVFPHEYPVWGVGDYRESCLMVRDSQGYRGCELCYEDYRILPGKPKLPGLPATFVREDAEQAGGGQTLEIICRDRILGLKVILRYSVFDDSDAIIRGVEVENEGTRPLYLEKVLSACLDMDAEEGYELLTLNGSWLRERRIERSPLSYGKQGVSSGRGESSHQEHPFIAVLEKQAGQDQGQVYGMHFVYSGNFLAQAEKSQYDSLRMVMGIHPEGFTWVLHPGERFTAPEVVCVYSDQGLGKMSRIFHDLYRGHLIRSPYLHQKRPVLINNWEATYFDFDSEKLLAIAREAKKQGIEMLVMDDGWFGRRDSDNCSLGDWVVNERKLKGGLKQLVDQVRKEGLLFGIWFEPEMISPDSDLYRKHPEWALQLPGRKGTLSREQYVLDLSRPEVLDYVYESVAAILRSADIAYVKWDMNRQLTDVGSSYLDSDHQGEVFHRYVLGVYALQERLVQEFPKLLLENCSGGGARFDPGMLYYSPQIWCSDDTDAIERLAIQEGTALLYPLSTMGAHVSDCPNHGVGRITPFATRGHVALAGTFGYELDITKISEEERKEIPGQIALYHKYQMLIREGDYYRIASWRENHCYDCWQVVSKDKKESLLTYVQVLAQPNVRSRKIYLKGLEPGADYRLEMEGGEESRILSGRLLMQGGLLIQRIHGDFISRLIHLTQV